MSERMLMSNTTHLLVAELLNTTGPQPQISHIDNAVKIVCSLDSTSQRGRIIYSSSFPEPEVIQQMAYITRCLSQCPTFSAHCYPSHLLDLYFLSKNISVIYIPNLSPPHFILPFITFKNYCCF